MKSSKRSMRKFLEKRLLFYRNMGIKIAYLTNEQSPAPAHCLSQWSSSHSKKILWSTLPNKNRRVFLLLLLLLFLYLVNNQHRQRKKNRKKKKKKSEFLGVRWDERLRNERIEILQTTYQQCKKMPWKVIFAKENMI